MQGYVSNLRSRRALPNDYWTAETVEDYMRCKVGGHTEVVGGQNGPVGQAGLMHILSNCQTLKVSNFATSH
jgi:hypothetical protein